MSVAEFVLVFVAIIIGIAVTDLLMSLHRLLRAWSRVKWDWLALSFATLMLFVTVLFWWFSYRWYQDATSATIAGFLPKLLFLLIAFLMIAASLPDEVPNEGLDLREFYLSSRTHLWSLVTLSLIVIVVINIVDRGVGWFDISRFWPQLISIALAGTAAVSRRVWLHALTIAWLFYWTVHWNLFARIGS
jgi:hypothetical protein